MPSAQKTAATNDHPITPIVGFDHRTAGDGIEAHCLDCDVRFARHGGCPKDRFITTPDGEPGLDYLCAGYKDFFHHVDGPMRFIAEQLRRGGAPSQIVQL